MRISDWSSDVCSSDLPVILSAGRLWDAAKNVRTLNKVAPRLPWPIAVAGDPRGPDGLICDGAENLQYLGTLNDSDMAGWLGRATVFALPARYEPFGLAVLEAALSDRKSTRLNSSH